MLPRPQPGARPKETIAIYSSSSDDDNDDYNMEDFNLADADLAMQSPGNAPLNTPSDDDSDWERVLRVTQDIEAAEHAQLERTNEMTQDDFFARILEVFPDIAHTHVLEKFRAKKEAGKEANGALCDEVIGEILDGNNYPKEREVRRENLKRKYRASTEESDYQEISATNNAQSGRYKEYATQLLLNEFPFVPKRFVTSTLSQNNSVFQAYLVFEEAERQYLTTASTDRDYRRVARPRMAREVNAPPTDMVLSGIREELAAVKKRVEKHKRKREEEERKRLDEENNEAVARANNEISECGCCFTEYPTNRMTFCNGEQLHFFCYDCVNSYVSNEIGQRKCRPKCMDTSGCDAEFPRSQLKALLEEKTFEILERLQQQEELREAGIEDLEECPFCDFKMICDPKEVDREFRCRNEDCAVVSCRLCQLETHVPLTCEQIAKDKKIDIRHKVEEAMTAALIRECNKCKNKFIKDYGCNKMTCTSCRNIQCYVCSKDVKDYNHFSDRQGGCPLYENTEQRHESEVKNAEKAAFEELKKDNPTMGEEDLKIQVSEAVKKAEKERIDRGARHPGVAGYNPGAQAAYYNAAFNAIPIPLPPRIPQLQNPGRNDCQPRPVGAGAPDAANREEACPCERLPGLLPPAHLPRVARALGCRCGRYDAGPEPPADAANPQPRPMPNPFMVPPAPEVPQLRHPFPHLLAARPGIDAAMLPQAMDLHLQQHMRQQQLLQQRHLQLQGFLQGHQRNGYEGHLQAHPQLAYDELMRERARQTAGRHNLEVAEMQRMAERVREREQQGQVEQEDRRAYRAIADAHRILNRARDHYP